jgi:protein-disulfide isomerase
MVSGLLVSGCANRKIADSKKPGTPATIDGIIVTESEIRSAAAAELESMELRKLREDAAYARTEREALMTALERVLEEKLLALEAAEQGVSKEQLIDREIRSKITEPSDEEIDRVYEANRARVNRPKEDVAEQIKEALRNQSEKEIREEYRGQLEKKRKVVRNLEPYRFDIKTGGRPSLGPDNAPVKLVLFSDFQCPYCSDFSITLMEVVKTYGDKVQLVFMQFPLTNIHPNAQFAAEASLCARDQKNFWKMHDILFENQRALTEENILKQIESLDIDSEIFKECLASGRHKSEIREDIRAAAASGTSSTPTLFINGLYLSGGQPYGLVSAMINQELASAGIEP